MVLNLVLICNMISRTTRVLADFFNCRRIINKSPVCLILGDNIFYGQGLRKLLINTNKSSSSTIFAYPVSDPERYGIVSFSKNKEVIDIEEKPTHPKSKYAITGLYFYDSTVVEKSKKISPSQRGELEISDINLLYLKERKLKVELFGRGMAWLDIEQLILCMKHLHLLKL